MERRGYLTGLRRGTLKEAHMDSGKAGFPHWGADSWIQSSKMRFCAFETHLWNESKGEWRHSPRLRLRCFEMFWYKYWTRTRKHNIKGFFNCQNRNQVNVLYKNILKYFKQTQNNQANTKIQQLKLHNIFLINIWYKFKNLFW